MSNPKKSVQRTNANVDTQHKISWIGQYEAAKKLRWTKHNDNQVHLRTIQQHVNNLPRV